MPPPPSYIDISSIPFSRTVTQAEFNGGTFGGVANEVWFRYIAAIPIVLGIQTNSGGTFTPRTTVYESDGSTTVDPDRTGTFGMWSAFTSAGTYYIKVRRSAGGASNFDFTSQFDTAQLDGITLEVGDRIINDDQDRPATVIAADGTLKGFATTVPGGEIGTILPSGVSIWHDLYGHYGSDKLVILDADLQFVASLNAGLTGVNFPIITTDATKFFVMNQAGELWTITAAGVGTNTGYVFGGSDPVKAIAANAAGTTMYWVSEDDDGIIHTINLNTFTDGSDLYTVPGWSAGVDKFAVTPNSHPGDMVVLDDGSLVTWWFESGALTYHLIHVSAAGALLHDIEFADPIQIDHIARIPGSTAAISIWLYTTNVFDTGRFGTLTFATEVIDEDFTVPLFEAGLNMLTGSTEMFGISTSCTFALMQAGAEGSPAPGSPEPGEGPPDGEIGPIAWVEEWEDGA